ncbi:MAG: cupin protein [Bradyrhizobium sp.]|jgi:hypothetical protein|nr:cupin protein [Bradyrhizobium sp.]
MGVQGRQAEGHNLQVGLDQLHSDPVRNNRASYWVVDQSANHDEDRRVMKGRKAAPFVSTYKDQIEAREQRHPSDRQEESESAVPSEELAKDELGNICVGNIKEEKR